VLEQRSLCVCAELRGAAYSTDGWRGSGSADDAKTNATVIVVYDAAVSNHRSCFRSRILTLTLCLNPKP